jgi:hypothetical protein
MIVERRSIPDTPDWHTHLGERLEWAKEIRLIARAARPNGDAQAFIPSTLSKETPPSRSPGLHGDEQRRSRGLLWIERQDVLPQVADWIVDQWRHAEGRLICEAGSARPDDRFLQREHHTVFDDRVFYELQLRSADAPMITKFLRKSRGWRILGVIVDGVARSTFDHTRGHFLCDALDMDTLITVPFETAS